MIKMHRKRKTGLLKILLMIVLIFMCLLSLRIGSTEMSFYEFFGGLMKKSEFSTESIILYSLRMPRILASVLSGTGLSISGILLQKITGNNLASPNIIGVNSGAGFVIMMILYFFPEGAVFRPFFAFSGAFSASLGIVLLSSKSRVSRSEVILSGIAVSTLLNSAISFMSYLDSDLLVDYNAFSIGSVSSVTYEEMFVPSIFIIVSLFSAIVLSRRTDILCLGDSLALSLGVNVKWLRIACLAVAGASAAAVVSFAGLLGFVGLVVPHIARKITDGSVKEMVEVGTLLGGVLVVTGDLLGRTLLAPSEIPVGIVMAFIGAPFLFYLLLKRRNENVGI